MKQGGNPLSNIFGKFLFWRTLLKFIVFFLTETLFLRMYMYCENQTIRYKREYYYISGEASIMYGFGYRR